MTEVWSTKMTRRDWLKGLTTVAAGGLLLPGWAMAAADGLMARPERALAFEHLHTGEKLNVVYWADGDYLPESLARVNHLLRDFRNDKATTMDPRLLDQLALLQQGCGRSCEFQIISGYRSPETNAMLRESSNGVAKHSMHLEGRAIDIRVPGLALNRLHDQALALQAGGVGYYPKSDFVHIDTGRVRQWGG